MVKPPLLGTEEEGWGSDSRVSKAMVMVTTEVLLLVFASTANGAVDERLTAVIKSRSRSSVAIWVPTLSACSRSACICPSDKTGFLGSQWLLMEHAHLRAAFDLLPFDCSYAFNTLCE